MTDRVDHAAALHTAQKHQHHDTGWGELAKAYISLTSEVEKLRRVRDAADRHLNPPRCLNCDEGYDDLPCTCLEPSGLAEALTAAKEGGG